MVVAGFGVRRGRIDRLRAADVPEASPAFDPDFAADVDCVASADGAGTGVGNSAAGVAMDQERSQGGDARSGAR